MRRAQVLGLTRRHGAPLVRFPYLLFGCTEAQAGGLV